MALHPRTAKGLARGVNMAVTLEPNVAFAGRHAYKKYMGWPYSVALYSFYAVVVGGITYKAVGTGQWRGMFEPDKTNSDHYGHKKMDFKNDPIRAKYLANMDPLVVAKLGGFTDDGMNTELSHMMKK